MTQATRRALLGMLALAPATARAASGPPGRIAAPEVATMLDGLMRIDDGDPTRPRIRVLYSPGCAHSLRMFEATRGRRMEASWRWIPYGGDHKGRASCAAALMANDIPALEASLRGEPRTGGDVGTMTAQDDMISRRIGRLLWDATGTALGTPTQVYRRSDGLFMAARGAMPPEALARMMEAAS